MELGKDNYMSRLYLSLHFLMIGILQILKLQHFMVLPKEKYAC